MSGSIREGQPDPTPSPPQIPRWNGCRCEDVEKGACCCYEDDGQVSHGGVHREGFDHGNHVGGQYVRS